MKVLAISGSERSEGNTEKLLNFVLGKISQQGIETELVTLYDKKIVGCTGCVQCRPNKAECIIRDDDFAPIFEKMLDADGILLGAPVYFGTAPAKLKGLLERAGVLSEGRVGRDVPINDLTWPDGKGPGLFQRKLGAAIVSTRRTGGNFTLAELLMWFIINNFIVIGSSYWPVAIGTRRIPKQKIGDKVISTHTSDQLETDKEAKHTLEDLAENFAWALRKIESSQVTPVAS
jgi:multimeric flavodoxin WrbA